MISSDLNQLLKKIKRHHRSSLPRPKGCLPPRPPFSYLLSVSLTFASSSSSSSSAIPFISPHDNESLPCGKGIICGTGSKMPCEPHYRMHDYHDSGAALVSTSYPPDPRGPRQVERPPPRTFLPPSCRYRRGIVETVNQRQGRVRGRGIGAACSSLPLRREHDAVVNWNAVASRIQVLLVSRCRCTRRIWINLLLPEIGVRIGQGGGALANDLMNIYEIVVPATALSPHVFLPTKEKTEGPKRRCCKSGRGKHHRDVTLRVSSVLLYWFPRVPRKFPSPRDFQRVFKRLYRKV